MNVEYQKLTLRFNDVSGKFLLNHTYVYDNIICKGRSPANWNYWVKNENKSKHIIKLCNQTDEHMELNTVTGFNCNRTVKSTFSKNFGKK